MSSKTNLGSQFLIIPGWEQKSVCFNLDVCLNFVSELIYLLSLCLVAPGAVRGQELTAPTAPAVSFNIKKQIKGLFLVNRSHSMVCEAINILKRCRLAS